jgi:hypothetical protein
MAIAGFVVAVVAATISVIIFIRLFLIDRIKENRILLIEMNNYLEGNTESFRSATFFMFEANKENFKKLSHRKKIHLVRKINKMIKSGEVRINLELFSEIERTNIV